jgi:hypothetical protein
VLVGIHALEIVSVTVFVSLGIAMVTVTTRAVTVASHLPTVTVTVGGEGIADGFSNRNSTFHYDRVGDRYCRRGQAGFDRSTTIAT